MTMMVERVSENAAIERPAAQRGASVEVASSRAAQEVQAAMVLAKRFPRDEMQALSRILQGCKRKGLAEAAVYSYPRGGTTVEGPSIRLAEAMAQAWGNVDFGIIELEQKNGESQVMAYAWDLETNTRQSKVFTVPHKRHTRAGDVRLTDPRDIYEMVANNGARRLRACILGIIPGDVQDAALAECDKTLKSGNAEPLIDRVRKMIGSFAEMGVTQAMIEARVNHKADVINEAEIIQLRKIYRSIADGASKRDDWFNVAGVAAAEGEDGGKSRADALADKLKGTTPPANGTDARQTGRPGPKKETPAPEGGEAEAEGVRKAQDAAAEAPDEPNDAEKCMIKAEEEVAGMTEEAIHAYVVGLHKDVAKIAKKMAQTELGQSATEQDWKNVATNAKAFTMNKALKK